MSDKIVLKTFAEEPFRIQKKNVDMKTFLNKRMLKSAVYSYLSNFNTIKDAFDDVFKHRSYSDSALQCEIVLAIAVSNEPYNETYDRLVVTGIALYFIEKLHTVVGDSLSKTACDIVKRRLTHNDVDPSDMETITHAITTSMHCNRWDDNTRTAKMTVSAIMENMRLDHTARGLISTIHTAIPCTALHYVNSLNLERNGAEWNEAMSTEIKRLRVEFIEHVNQIIGFGD